MQARVEKQIAELQKTRAGNYQSSSRISSSDWSICVGAPKGSIYQSVKLQLLFRFNDEYPHQPPEVIPQTPIHHINLQKDTKISLPILGDDWSAFLNISKILLKIEAVLLEPDTSCPVNPKLLTQYEQNPQQFERIARQPNGLSAIQLKTYTEGSAEQLNFNQAKQKISVEDIKSVQYQSQTQLAQSPLLRNPPQSSFKDQAEQKRFLDRCKVEMEKISQSCLDLEGELGMVKSEQLRRTIERELKDLSELRQRIWRKYYEVYRSQVQASLQLL